MIDSKSMGTKGSTAARTGTGVGPHRRWGRNSRFVVLLGVLLPLSAAAAERSAAEATASRSPGVVAEAPPPTKGPRVVTTMTTYAAIAREIVGDRGEVTAIANGAENPHYVTPRPSLLLQVRRADLFVVTGLDLELWVPAVEDKANNPRIRPGAPGYVTASEGLRLLELPQSVSRAEGDIHLFGNPHIWTSPVNAIQVGANILAGLERVAPENADVYRSRYAAWREKILRQLVGDEIVEILGSDLVFDLARKGRLLDFLEQQTFQGKPLAARLGGWLARARAFRGKEMVCYHREWVYFSDVFGVPCVEFVEPKPGIPPTPKHVADVIRLMRERKIPVLLSTNYYDRNQVESVAERTGARAVIVPSNVDGAPGTETYSRLVDLWVDSLAKAFENRG